MKENGEPETTNDNPRANSTTPSKSTRKRRGTPLRNAQSPILLQFPRPALSAPAYGHRMIPLQQISSRVAPVGNQSNVLLLNHVRPPGIDCNQRSTGSSGVYVPNNAVNPSSTTSLPFLPTATHSLINQPCITPNLSPSHTVTSSSLDLRPWNRFQNALSIAVPMADENVQPSMERQHVNTSWVPASGTNHHSSSDLQATGLMVSSTKITGHRASGGLHSAGLVARSVSSGIRLLKIPLVSASPPTAVPLAVKLARSCSKRQSATFATFASSSNTLSGSTGSVHPSGTSSSNRRQQRSPQDSQPCKFKHCKGPVAESFGYFLGTLDNINVPKNDATSRVASSLLDPAFDIGVNQTLAGQYTEPQNVGSHRDTSGHTNKIRHRMEKIAPERQGRGSSKSKLQRIGKSGQKSTDPKGKKPRQPMEHCGFIYAYERTSGTGTEYVKPSLRKRSLSSPPLSFSNLTDSITWYTV
ncbi:hypothetical protein QAD02_002186 [Eretmocerus hayati]|uniref:Uncharacterized protein n=1 Tax=Eretmocerus hayati TaxID=131215 RepID=A0ACC2NIK5_9HYME|nr:hypothetical protein QAD02_002186 [Eretmocerus hayati]